MCNTLDNLFNGLKEYTVGVCYLRWWVGGRYKLMKYF